MKQKELSQLDHPVEGSFLTSVEDTTVGENESDLFNGTSPCVGDIGNLPGQSGHEIFGRGWDSKKKGVKKF